WDINTEKVIQRFVGHTEDVWTSAYSPDGTQVLTGSSDGTVRLWDIATGKEIRRYQGHTGGVAGVAFSPDGSQILSGSYDYTAQLWDVDFHKTILAACKFIFRDLTSEELTRYAMNFQTSPQKTCDSG